MIKSIKLKNWKSYKAAANTAFNFLKALFRGPWKNGSGQRPADLIGNFHLIFYSSAEDAVFKALGAE